MVEAENVSNHPRTPSIFIDGYLQFVEGSLMQAGSTVFNQLRSFYNGQ
jgi:hypothetical protein